MNRPSVENQKKEEFIPKNDTPQSPGFSILAAHPPGLCRVFGLLLMVWESARRRR